MRIAIFGAGSIGCYVGGRLLANGEDVVFCGRPRIARAVTEHGLTLSHFRLPALSVEPDVIQFVTTPDVLADADIILVTVKSQASEEAAAQLAAHASAGALVVSLQNGVRNAALLKSALSGFEVAAGMVPFNVVNRGDGSFHCGTEGALMIARGVRTDDLVKRLGRAGIDAIGARDMDAVLWGKLLMNLNNALNLISNLPLKQQLGQRDYRRVMALCIDEARRVLRGARIRPASVGKVVPALLPAILRLPNALFQIIARSMLRIDPQARSSMWEDLQASRESEIDYLNGEITRLGDELAIPTPVNKRIVALVRAAFDSGVSPSLSGAELLALVSTRPDNSAADT